VQNGYFSEQDDVEMGKVIGNEGYGEKKQRKNDYPQVEPEPLSDDKEDSHDKEDK
jgi:hypothetical protein